MSRKINSKIIEVNHKDLPLVCPREFDPIWNLHPKVFLNVKNNGEIRCPYCGTLYILKKK